ncbi:MAG: dihydroorotase [Candidatus Dormibacteria bacterium]
MTVGVDARVRMISPAAPERLPSLLLSGGEVLDPFTGRTGPADILVEDGIISRIGAPRRSGALTIDCTGRTLTPAFTDLHVHLRHPGQPEKETIGSGTAAAAAGGFGTLLAMANTRPPIDSPEVLERALNDLGLAARVRVGQVAAVSLALEGESPADHDALARAGAVALSDDGRNVHSSAVMRQALRASRRTGLPVLVHAEDRALAAQGAMHLGYVSRELGLPGMDPEAESAVIERDLALLREEGGRLHIQHVSAERSFRLIEAARREGLAVTCEVTPHHLLLTDEEVRRHGGRARVHPPLRDRRDRDAALEALLSGVVDAVATDHAPHEPACKDLPIGTACPGFSGLETAFAVLGSLVEQGTLPLDLAVASLTSGPARLLTHLDREWGLVEGAPADIAVIDAGEGWTVDSREFRSLGRNTLLDGMRLTGTVVATIVDGRVAHLREVDQ